MTREIPAGAEYVGEANRVSALFMTCIRAALRCDIEYLDYESVYQEGCFISMHHGDVLYQTVRAELRAEALACRTAALADLGRLGPSDFAAAGLPLDAGVRLGRFPATTAHLLCLVPLVELGALAVDRAMWREVSALLAHCRAAPPGGRAREAVASRTATRVQRYGRGLVLLGYVCMYLDRNFCPRRGLPNLKQLGAAALAEALEPVLQHFGLRLEAGPDLDGDALTVVDEKE